MLEQRNSKLDVFALGLLALVIFLALALATYDPADPPSSLVYPPNPTTHNLCGRAGSLVASVLFHMLGLGAWYLLVSLAALDARLLAGRPISERWLRSLGWGLSLVGVATFCALALGSFAPGPAIGSGGYLGAIGRALLEMNFASAGAYVLTLSLIVGGLFLSTDYFLLRASAWAIKAPVKGVKRTLEKRRTSMKTGDIDGAYAVEKDVAIRIRGKTLTEDEAGEDEAEAEAADSAEQKEVVAGEPGQDAATAEGAEGDANSELRIRGRPKRDERKAVMKELDEAASRTEDTSDYELPPIDLLMESEPVMLEEHEKEVRRKAKVLEKTFGSFGFNVKVVEIETGPVIAQYEVELEAGLRLSKITGLADDIAIALRVPSVRIVAPIPGKNTVGIEIPNETRQLVRLREVIEESNSKAQKMRIPIYLGKDVAGNSMVADLASLPHLLIAGRTGTGKSVCLNTIIVSMLMSRRPDEVRMLMIDPKMVELSPYKTLPHLMHPVVTDMKKAEAILAWAVEKMEERYALLARAGVRHISGYNQLGEEELMERLQPENDEERKNIPTNLPYIVIVADEMADLMMTSAKEVETHIIRLAQKSRAVGIHLVLATQKPTVDVITGLIKSNLPARIAFQVASRTDSRVVLDEMGADKLLGNGDMLFLWPGTSTLIRGQGTYVSDEEITKIVDFVGTTEPEFVTELVQLKTNAPGESDSDRFKQRDELYEAAIDIVVREGRGSVSLLQRALGIGYGRGARLIDFMAEDGFVGAYNGSQAREVLLTVEQWEAMTGQGGASSQPALAPPVATTKRASNKILPKPVADEDDADDEVDEADDYDAEEGDASDYEDGDAEADDGEDDDEYAESA